VSTSNLQVIADWVADEGFQYEVWRDDTGDLGVYYGALPGPTGPNPGSPSRITKVLDADGTLMLEYPQVSVSTHPASVLTDLQILLAD
jgi:peroxiredoxin